MANKQAEAGNAEAAMALVNEIVEVTLRCLTLSRSAEALAKRGNSESARMFIQSALESLDAVDERRRTEPLRAIAGAQATAGNISAALASIEMIVGASARAKGLAEIAQIQAEAGHAGAALATLERIKPVVVRAEALCGTVRKQAEAGDVAGAIATAKLIEPGPDDPEMLVFMAEWAFNHGNLAEASEALRTFGRHVLSDRAWGGIVEAQAAAGDVEAALATANKITPGWERAWVLARMAEARQSQGDSQGARKAIAAGLAITGRIEEDFQREDGWGVIALAQSRVEGAEAALWTAARIASADWRVVALSGIARAGAEAGDMTSAHEAVQAALVAADEIKGADDRASAFGRIAVAQADFGDVLGSLSTAERIDDAATRAAELAYAARLLAKDGNREACRRAATAALVAAHEVEDDFARAQALVMVLALLPD
jgi:tetratricopeptide (TPR) repeat protein